VGGLFFAWEGREQAPLLMASFGFLQDRWGTEAAKFHELYVEDPRHRLPAHVLILDHPSSGPFLANNDLLSVGSYDDAQMWIEIASVLRDNPEVESIHLFGVSMSGQTVVHALIEDARRGLSLFSSGMAVSIAPDTQQAPGRQLARLATTEGVTNPWRALAPGAHEHSGDGIQAQTVRLLLSRQFVPGYRRLRPEDEDFEIPSESIPTFLWRAFEDRLGFRRRSRRLHWNHDFTLESLPAFLRTTRIEAVVDRVRTPLLLLSAEDDPAVRRESFREVVDAASSNPWILAYEAERGGHFGFDMAYGRGYLGELLRLMIDPTLMQSWNAEPGGQASRSRGRLTP